MANNELTIVDHIKNAVTTTDKSEYKVPVASIFGRGLMENKESFGGLTLHENAQRTDAAIQNTIGLQNVWNHSHSQWTWKHITLSYSSDFRNMKQIEAEMSRKRQALNEAKWRHIKAQIKIQKLENFNTDDEFEVLEKQIKIAELREQIVEGTAYIEGAMKDVLALNELYEQLKARVANFTEEDFERDESKSHLKRSITQCIRDVRQFGNITKGEQEYLEQIGVNPSKMNIILREYVKQETETWDWSTTGLVTFVNGLVDDLIDNKKVDIIRMKLMGFDHDIVKGIGYDKVVAEKDNG